MYLIWTNLSTKEKLAKSVFFRQNIRMHFNQIEQWLLRVVKACLYLVVFAPILITSVFFFPAIFTKVVYVRLLMEIALIAYVPLAIMSPQYRPTKNVVTLLVGLFAALVVITSLTGINFNFSMWGNYERMDGIFSWAHYWALFFIAASVLKTKREWQKLFAASIVAALLIAWYGFLQRAGSSRVYESGVGRITGTLGNPGFLAAYLLFHLTFALHILLDKLVAWKWRIVAGIALVVLLVAEVLTGIRGAFIGLLAGLGFFVVGYTIFVASPRLKKITIPVFALFFVVIGLLFVFRSHDVVRENQIFGRFFDIRLDDETTQTRLISWGGALKGIKENFWLGVGPQKFDVIFNKYFNPEFYTLVGSETWWDRSHNMFLEVFSTMGVFGMLVYMGIGAGLFFLLWRIGASSRDNRLEALLIAAFFIAYFIQNLFVFDSVSTYIALALLMGYVVARSHETGSPAFFGARFEALGEWLARVSGVVFSPIKPAYWKIGLVLAFVLVAPVAYAENVKLIRHNIVFLSALRPDKKSFSDRLEIFRETLAISDFDQREVAIKLGQFVSQHALSNSLTLPELTASFSFTLTTFEKAVQANPKDVRLLLSYGNAANTYGELLLKAKETDQAARVLKKAENILLEAASLGRARQQVFFSLANTHLIRGDNNRAIDVIEQTIALNENTPSAYWVASLAYIQAGENDQAIAAGLAAIEKGYHFAQEQEVSPIAKILINQKEYEALLVFYEQLAQDIPTGTAQAKLAALLAQMGRREEAVAAAREVIERDASLRAQAEEFIRIVESGVPYNFVESGD